MHEIYGYIRNYLQRISTYGWWRPLFEWVLIGVVIYGILRFMRGTRGARLLKGAALILVVAYVVIKLLASQLGLERIEVLYKHALIGALFALAIVFQPELRRVLMRIGETRLFRGWERKVNVMVDQLVVAVKYLSENKIGALIAVERETGLVGLAESGVRLDAELSPDLLTTIFWPGSALHDMGVIIQEGRVTAAGCQFPLAESGELPRGLGSRHRAAMGLSLDTDALVVVVSEETGQISLATRGQMIRPLTPDQLRQQLLSRLAPALADKAEAARHASVASPGHAEASVAEGGADAAAADPAQNHVSRSARRVLKMGKNLVLVVLLTGLIWVWAEQAQTVHISEQPISLRVQVPPSDKVAITLDPQKRTWDRSVNINLEASFVGPQGGIATLMERIRRDEYHPVYRLSHEAVTGEKYELQLSDALNDQYVLSQFHIGVASLSARTAEIYISPLVESHLTVRLDKIIGAHGEPKWREKPITIELPKELDERLTTPEDRTVLVSVRVPEDAGERPVSVPMPPDFHGFPVRDWPDLTVAFDANRPAPVVTTLDNVPVDVQFPRNLRADQYYLDPAFNKDQWLKTITVEGPRRLERKDVDVYLKLEAGDVNGSDAGTPRDVVIHVPPGFTVTAPAEGTPQRSILFRLIRVKEGPGT
ncbi:MAG: hypothetical protein BIFFINMI_03121 [Phycisphaerae bacterium]|nr:hypothetical protein [Phycisphaerae bacterium]